MKVYCVSDIHTDFPTNFTYIESLPNQKDSILIVCGDISDNLLIVEKTFKSLKLKYLAVFFIPGNHELWVGRSDKINTSMEKCEVLLKLCNELGVYTSPTKINDDLTIIPMFGWYHPSFDEDYVKMSSGEQAKMYESLKTQWGDFRHCKWDIKELDLPKYFLKVNETRYKEFISKNPTPTPNVITFTHFVPRRELLPPRDVLLKKVLPMLVGCCEIDTQLRLFKSTCHVFGHTHIDYDVTIDGVRYVQNAFGSPAEREGWKKSFITGPYEPKLIYDK